MKYYIVNDDKSYIDSVYKVMRKRPILFGLLSRTEYACYFPNTKRLLWYPYKDLADTFGSEAKAEEIIALSMKMEGRKDTTIREVPPFLYYKERE